MSAEDKIREILEDYSLFLELPEGIPQRESQRELPDINDAVDRLTDLMAEARIEELQNLIGLDDEGKEPDYAMRIVDRIRSLRYKEENPNA